MEQFCGTTGFSQEEVCENAPIVGVLRMRGDRRGVEKLRMGYFLQTDAFFAHTLSWYCRAKASAVAARVVASFVAL